jgi:predicted anti-sigma-YlaC factor YlaD
MDNHPTEEVLSLCALDDQCATIESHLQSCDSCRELVDDIRSIKSNLASFGEEEIPPTLDERILSIMKEKNKSNRLPPFIQEWYKRPFVYGIITALAAVISYVIFAYFL